MIQAHSVGGGMQNMERGFQPVQMCSHAVLNPSIFLAKNVTINILEGACQCTAESRSDVLPFLCCDMWTMVQGHFGGGNVQNTFTGGLAAVRKERER